MPPTHPDHSRVPAPAGSTSPERPGWPEIAVGLLATVVAIAAAALFGPWGLDLPPVAHGLALTAWSGVVGLVGFAAAAMVRIRSWGAFGVRRTTWRWMLLGLAGGVVALVVKAAVISAITALTGFDSDPQGAYYEAAGGGVLPLVLTFLFLAVLTPIGEEFLFRGVVANALLRYGPVIGVVSSSVVFALFHGINIILPAALVVGLIAAELMRRSGSVWPAVAVHAVNNAALPLLVLLTGYAGPG
ncbi:CPBP family intramembrane glutamic endopeptidase [Marinitenerispora sediminis]|uniref:CPBP family intramembrane metalloprotease n=1 Tax=Marinitenerispora sediminis TaxID=1931232 RepID=A0A368T357_9ACTN|nr:CPBP family intramembrane glutamic endopeptidase [Marinitenerispora sediminis]RCV48450.1 CPBP family intramembrane metalloprotease [Marinitenerispora sediminis]RCV52520.1 CPBP family intramembrane metalloprotease [Marinitenerispora sediminis]RCV56386.1 CPBP family intramembrane metalloprotease [Marinitenerispora sediminis]